MSLERKQLFRLAGNIRDQLCVMERNKRQLLPQKLQRAIEQTEALGKIRQRLEMCLDRKWIYACEEVVRSIDPALRDARHKIEVVERAFRQWPGKIPSHRDILEDLIQAEEEFGALKYDPEEHTFSIITEPVTLEGVYLGPFEVRIHIDGLTEAHYGRGYDIIALDPHPASTDEGITHPHVSNTQLCPGDAAVPICAALTEGRMCDVFQLIHSVLTTYNPNSPYIPIDQWDGVPCYECGFVMSPDETYWCQSCMADFCGECSSCCTCCDETTCLSCLKVCPVCEESACPSCMVKCPDCEILEICIHCADEESCPCHNQEVEDDECEQNSGKENGTSGNKVEKIVAQTTAGVAVHTDGVGEAAVFQGQRSD